MSYIEHIQSNERFEIYKRNSKYYEGLHWDVNAINTFEYFKNPKLDYLAYNFQEVLTDSIVDLMFARPPIITFENTANQKFWDEFSDYCEFIPMLREAAQMASYCGDAVFSIGTDENIFGEYQTYIDLKSPWNWYPILNSKNDRKARGHILYTEKNIGEDKQKKVAKLLEIHLPGEIIWESYVQEENGENKKVSPMVYFFDEMKDVLVDGFDEITQSFYFETNVKYPLVFHLRNNRIPNNHTVGGYFGISDYTDPINAKTKGFNQNTNQRQYILRKHAHPKMVVPKSMIQQAIKQIKSNDEKAKSFNFRSKEAAMEAAASDKNLFETLVAQKIMDKMEFFGADIQDQRPEYLTWDGQLEASFKHNIDLKDQLLDEAKLAKVLIHPEIATGNLTGAALMRLAQPSLNKAQKKIDYMVGTIKKMAYAMIELSKVARIPKTDPLEAQYPTVKFQEGIVEEISEVIDRTQKLAENGWIGKTEAIMETRGMDRKQAETVMKEASKESMERMQMFMIDGPNNDDQTTV